MAFDSPLAQFLIACGEVGFGDSIRKRAQAQRKAKAIHKQAKRKKRATAVYTVALVANKAIKNLIDKS